MIKWQIPAKTFLLGEYAALHGDSALVLTTAPYFDLVLQKESGLMAKIHPHSPAGRWWQQYQNSGYYLEWQDPYQGRGGLGASSAQFIAAYYASAALNKLSLDKSAILEAYYQSSWSGEGIKPSGYDVLAQLEPAGFGVYINRNKHILLASAWPFDDLAFILLHTGKKLATHEHLANTRLPQKTERLSELADQGFQAFQEKNSQLLIEAVNSSYQELLNLKLVAAHSQQYIDDLKEHKSILAMKGCGAMGADVIVLLLRTKDLKTTHAELLADGHCILASSSGFY